jgi:hypothetical protein
MAFHENMTHITGAGHQIHRYEFANATARALGTGYTFEVSDIKKVAMQLDDFSSWVLTNNSPITWAKLGVGANSTVYASDIVNTPTGNIIATDVQAAITELDSEKEPVNANIQAHIASTSNPHTVTKDQVGLANADNTSDALKPISTATQSALDLKAPLNSPAFTGTATGLTKAMVGLGSVVDVEQVPLSTKGQASGVCPLGTDSKIAEAYLPDSVLGQVDYQGLWTASTNNPTLPTAATANKGWYYICQDSGTQFTIAFVTGDWVISNGSSWNKVDNTDAVSTVFGRTGPIVAAGGDYSAAQVTNTPAGGIAAATVQAALNELDGDKEPANSNIQSHIASTSNPHSVTAAQVGALATGTKGTASGVAPLDAGSLVPYANLPLGSKVYDFAGSWVGKVTAAGTIGMFVAVRSFTIPANWAGSVVRSRVAATASFVLTVDRNGAAFSSWTFGAGSTTTTAAGIADTVINAGDLFRIYTTGTDTTCEDIVWCVLGRFAV